jgi:hypothetical protein
LKEFENKVSKINSVYLFAVEVADPVGLLVLHPAATPSLLILFSTITRGFSDLTSPKKNSQEIVIEGPIAENNEPNASKDKKEEHVEDDKSEKTVNDSNKKPKPLAKPIDESSKLSQNQQNKLKKKLSKEKAALNASKETNDDDFEWADADMKKDLENETLEAVEAQNQPMNVKAGGFKRQFSPKSNEKEVKKLKNKH